MPFRLIVMGASAGGLAPLRIIISALPASFPLPVVVVQHLLSSHRSKLARILARDSRLSVTEACDKQSLAPGVFTGPAGYHLLVDCDFSLALSVDAPVCHSRPSIDVLFESAAVAFGSGVIAVALSCASTDGLDGARAVRRCGGVVIAQDPQEAEVRRLPEAIVSAGEADWTLPMGSIAPKLLELVAETSRPFMSEHEERAPF